MTTTYFDEKQNKSKHLEAEKKLRELSKKISQISIKEYDFLLSQMYFTGTDGYESFLGFFTNA